MRERGREEIEENTFLFAYKKIINHNRNE